MHPTAKIVYIPGIFGFSWLTKTIAGRLKKAFADRLPGALFATESLFYSPWERKKILAFGEAILTKHDEEGHEVILLGYSMGGVIATAIAPRFEKADVRVVTIMSPHKFLWGLFSWMLGAKMMVDDGLSIITVQGMLDLVVSCGAKHPRTKSHHKIWWDYFLGLLFSDKPAKQIAEAAMSE